MRATILMLFVLGISLLFVGAWYAMDNPEGEAEKTLAGWIIFWGIVIVLVSIFLAWREEEIVGRGKNEIQS